MTGYRNFLKISHFEVDVDMKEKIPLTSLFVDSTQIFQSLIRHENNMVLCSLTARESQDKKVFKKNNFFSH